jgi:hypothetical protein
VVDPAAGDPVALDQLGCGLEDSLTRGPALRGKPERGVFCPLLMILIS